MSKIAPKLTRRGFLACCNAIAGAGILGLNPAFAAQETLRQAAAEKGILYGSSISPWDLEDPSIGRLLARECSIAVPENSLKWDAIRPTATTFNFMYPDRLCAFALSHNMAFRGHTLVWEHALPNWFDRTVNSGNAERVLLGHISTVVRHYAGKMHSWDVVNEAVQVQDGRADGLKVTPWLQYIGPEYIEMAFHAAHKADPHVMLVYNQNLIESEGAYFEKRRRATLGLLANLKKKGAPVDALGVQSHIRPDLSATGPDYKQFLREVEDLGLSILVTEMDVRERELPADVELRDRLVAEQYYKYLSFMLQFKSVKTVLTWGLTNRHTWMAQTLPRPDGLPVRPLPFDAELRPTPSWEAIQRAFKQASIR